MNNVQVTDVSTTRRFFKATLLPKDAGDSLVVRIDFDPKSYNQDAGAADLIVVTNNEKQPKLTIPLKVVP